ncbi:MAG: hypothetical protein GC205_08435 [Bacteroidetes bacterium]|nr:hypothetical protein [Bacteroidota bacterium]
MKISTAFRLSIAVGLFVACATHVSAQSHAISISHAAIDGPRTGTGSSGSTSGTVTADATVEVYPTTAKRTLNVRLTGAPTAIYSMGFRRPDGSVIQAWEALVIADTTLVIDIEKVETGVLTFFIQVGDQELTASFYHVL